jgi:hypothetical protein
VISIKKSIAAAFQANFEGTDEVEEIDPQSRHKSHYTYVVVRGTSILIICLHFQARRQGGSGGYREPPFLSFFIHMNLYDIYVSHTSLIESRTPFCEKEPPFARGCIQA